MVRIQKINTNYSNNYLVFGKGSCLLIDCSCDISMLLKYTTKLDAIIITHGHFDHFYMLEAVQSYFKCPVYMHANAIPKLIDSSLNASGYFDDKLVCKLPVSSIVVLNPGKNQIADISVEIFDSAGHTDDSILIAIENSLFVGDFLFSRGYGRTDLPTGSAEEMYKNLRKYLPFRKKYTLYYGHDSD